LAHSSSLGIISGQRRAHGAPGWSLLTSGWPIDWDVAMKTMIATAVGAMLIAATAGQAAGAAERTHAARYQQPAGAGWTGHSREAYDYYPGWGREPVKIYGVYPGLIYGGATSPPAGR
jgi:hypothetical protein